MAEYIDKSKLIADIVNTGSVDLQNLPFEPAALLIEFANWQDKLIKIIKRQPAAEVEPMRHGRWEWIGPNFLVKECACGTCSACKVRSKYIVNREICPNCGARMDLGGAENA